MDLTLAESFPRSQNMRGALRHLPHQLGHNDLRGPQNEKPESRKRTENKERAKSKNSEEKAVQ